MDGIGWHCWHGSSRFDPAGYGAERLARQCVAWFGKACPGRHGTKWQPLVLHGWLGLAWYEVGTPGFARLAWTRIA